MKKDNESYQKILRYCQLRRKAEQKKGKRWRRIKGILLSIGGKVLKMVTLALFGVGSLIKLGFHLGSSGTKKQLDNCLIEKQQCQ